MIVSMISDHFPHDRRRVPTSVFMAGDILGATAAFLFGGLVIAAFDRLGEFQGLASWRLTLITVGLMGLPIIALFALAVSEPSRPKDATAVASAAATYRHLRALRQAFKMGQCSPGDDDRCSIIELMRYVIT